MQSFACLVGVVSVLALAVSPPTQEPDVLKRAPAVLGVNVIKTLEERGESKTWTELLLGALRPAALGQTTNLGAAQ